MFEEYCEECVIEFDCVCTLYFIDTAMNIIDYIKEQEAGGKSIMIDISPTTHEQI